MYRYIIFQLIFYLIKTCIEATPCQVYTTEGRFIATKAQLVFHLKSFFKYILLRNLNYCIMEKKKFMKGPLDSF